MTKHECSVCRRPFESESASPNFCPYGCGALSSDGEIIGGLDRLIQWARAKDPNATIWLHAAMAKEHILAKARGEQ